MEHTYAQIGHLVHRTPVLSSRLINEISGAEVYFKCENFQKSGSFKMRGALNAISNLSSAQQRSGVVTHSSGNFGQAVALSAANLGVEAHIVMPINAPDVKKKAVTQYGGNIIQCEATLEARERNAGNIVASKGASFLHPSNQIEVILGNATAGMELLQDHPELDVLMTPVGGGGLLAGNALAAHYFGQDCTVIGAEPALVDDAYRSLLSGKIEGNTRTDTIADGLRTTLGSVNFPIITQLVDQIIRVEEDEIISALKLVWERLKIIIEPSCAVPVAALLKEPEKFRGKRVGIILSGGNVDLSKLPF
ncbi:serine dehydratase [Aureitalea marina]|uniref:Serine dehydratase n=1 Tax=Aureitalea marina TaxID=930804 RepID=A0A2S7KTC0_9FLAO|nr:serine dehydratase [Aureitalea marina]